MFYKDIGSIHDMCNTVFWINENTTMSGNRKKISLYVTILTWSKIKRLTDTRYTLKIASQRTQ